ncbi:MAG: iron ABC transporter permease [Acidiferrobacterales bacterium]|nr:iron ABC transporter permease [Acidiferrobacterales bacterium]
MNTKTNTLLICLSLAVMIGFLASLSVGPVGIGTWAVLSSIFSDGSDIAVIIAQEIRLPRALLGAAIGATLGICGAAMQGYVRNPLAEPGLIGVSASAALGAVLTIYFGLSTLYVWTLPLGGMIGASVGVMIMVIIAGRGSSTLTLILAGVAVSTLAGALTSLALNLAPNPFAAVEIIFWLLGSLANRSMEHVWLAGPFMLIGIALLLTVGKSLDALSLGEDTASTLGVNVRRVRMQIIVGVTVSVGAATAVAGAIGFVGLVVPHLLRPLVGHRPGILLPASALGGAILLLFSDVAVRMLSFGPELKLGVFTALVGSPFFLWLVLKMRSQFI